MDEVLHRLSKLFQALGNGIRLRILTRLRDGETNVTELADHVGKSVHTVSHHMRILRDNNLVNSETDGRQRIYGLKRPALVNAALALTEFLERDTS